MSPVVVAYHFFTIPLPIPYHSITKSISRCEGRHVGVAVNTDMSPKWPAGPLNFSVANSYYESYQIGPPSAIHAPPSIACQQILMSSIRPTTFLPTGRQTLLASQIKSPEIANSVDAHVAGDACLPFPYISLINPLPVAYRIDNSV